MFPQEENKSYLLNDFRGVMKKTKTFRSVLGLALSLAFWIFLVVFLLTTNIDFHDVYTENNYDQGTAIASIPDQEMNTVEPVPFPSPETIELTTPPPQYHEIKGELKRGEGLDDSFKRLQISGNIRNEIIQTFSGTLDFKHLRPGDCYTITLDENDQLVSCTYESGPLHIYRLTKTDDRFLAEKVSIPLEVRTIKLAGVIGSSLFEAFTELGEDAKLIHAFANIFASKIDFNTETRQGDRFSLAFEKYFKNDQFVAYGRILVARYEQSDQTWEGFYYSSSKTPSAHFNEKGEELGTSFLRSPIPFGRVTSRFSYRRKHPILHVVRAHLGVDLAAPIGTPIMAASDGKVIFKGWKGGYGKHVIIKHANDYRTYYGHLSRYKKGLHVGSRVKQKDIIGYVGMTGLATGPHLDYRISYEGVFKNPFSIKFKPKSVLAGQELENFLQERMRLAKLIEAADDKMVLKVKKVVLGEDKEIAFL